MRFFLFIPALTMLFGCSSVPNQVEPPSTLEPPRPLYELPNVVAPRSPIEDVFGETPTCTKAEPREDGAISIQTNQFVCVLFELEGGYLIPRTSARVFDDSVILKMAESEDGDRVTLVVYNPYDGILKYRAGMRLPGRSGYYATSSCGVISGGASFEMWSHPIEEIAVTDFQIFPEGDSISCN